MAVVGVFDSGLGGLTVAREIVRQAPGLDILYFADTFNVPYGDKDPEDVKKYALHITDFLVEKGAEAIVMACNMSSSIALDYAREKYPMIPVIGVVDPGARQAASVAEGRPIGVLATTGTVKSGAYKEAIGRYSPASVVVQQACPRFVPLIEQGLFASEEAENATRLYVGTLKAAECSTIILGCTHYPFVKGLVQKAAGDEVAVVDPAGETAMELVRSLAPEDTSPEAKPGLRTYFVSGPFDVFSAQGSEFMGEPVANIESVAWGEHVGIEEKSLAV